MRSKLYKVLVDGRSCHGGNMVWSLPKGRRAGRWHAHDGDLVPCSSGLHLKKDYVKWLKAGCESYEAEADGEIVERDDDKVVCKRVRLLRRVTVPVWWNRVEEFVASIKGVPFFRMTDGVRPEWRVFSGKTWAAAWDAGGAAAWDAAWDAARAAARAAAWDAARDAARDAAWDAAWDAALYADSLIAPKGTIAQKHIDHIKARWDVWRRGYGLLCDVNGVLYVYRAAV